MLRSACYTTLLLALTLAAGAVRAEKADSVLVVKSERQLYLVNDGRQFATYPVTFGSNPKGHNQKQGDGRAFHDKAGIVRGTIGCYLPGSCNATGQT